MYNINIEKAMNGFVIGVGCQRLVFESKETLIKELDRYLTDPEKVEQEYKTKYNYSGPVLQEAYPQPVNGNGDCVAASRY